MELELKFETNADIVLTMGKIKREAKWAAKYAIDLAANESRDGMEEMAMDRFSVKTNWAKQRLATGYRARNARLNGTTNAPLTPVPNGMVAGAYSGEKADWIGRQEKGGLSKSNTTPVYESSGKKINKGNSAFNKRFDVAGGPNMVFGRKGMTKTRGGLRKAITEYKSTKRKKRVFEYKNSGYYYRINDYLYRKLLKAGGDKKLAFKGAAQLIFVKKTGKFQVRKRTSYDTIMFEQSALLVPRFYGQLDRNLSKALEKKLK